MSEHSFCRLLLKTTMTDVRKRTSVQERKQSWAYRYDGSCSDAEFHGPHGFYDHFRACCLYHARAKGWIEYISWLHDTEKNPMIRSSHPRTAPNGLKWAGSSFKKHDFTEKITEGRLIIYLEQEYSSNHPRGYHASLGLGFLNITSVQTNTDTGEIAYKSVVTPVGECRSDAIRVRNFVPLDRTQKFDEKVISHWLKQEYLNYILLELVQKIEGKKCTLYSGQVFFIKNEEHVKQINQMFIKAPS